MQPHAVTTETEARAVLRLPAGAPLAAWRPAFSLAIKAAHPDHGGTTDGAQRVLEAYSLLKGLETQRHRHPSVDAPGAEAHGPSVFEITIEEAFKGISRDVVLEPGRSFRVRLPAGLCSGDLVAFEPRGKRWRIHVTEHADMRLEGSDLWLTVGSSRAFLRRGGPLTVSLPIVRQNLWVTRNMAARRVVPLPGAGLPARDTRRAGDAFIRLVEVTDQSKRSNRTGETKATDASRTAA